jgi:hypothetical protein
MKDLKNLLDGPKYISYGGYQKFVEMVEADKHNDEIGAQFRVHPIHIYKWRKKYEQQKG